MANYLKLQIELGNLMYAAVVAKFPKYKTAIDDGLSADKYTVNSDGNCVYNG